MYNYYWSSTESDLDNAWGFYFNNGYVEYPSTKSTNAYVRAVKSITI
jgi:hypothetical protein